MERPQVLVIHREPGLRRLVAESFGEDRVRVLSASSDEEGLSLLRSNRVHVLVAGLDVLSLGYEFVRQAAAIHPFLGVVLLVDADCLDNVPQRMPPAAVQYLRQPVTRDSLRSSIQRALEQQTRRRAADGGTGFQPVSKHGQDGRATSPRTETSFQPAEARSSADGPMIAASKAMREVLELVRRSAPTDAAVLIHGEPDTGKELLARQIHRQSPRAGAPSCGSRAARCASRRSLSGFSATPPFWTARGEEPSSFTTLRNCRCGPRSCCWTLYSKGRTLAAEIGGPRPLACG